MDKDNTFNQNDAKELYAILEFYESLGIAEVISDQPTTWLKPEKIKTEFPNQKKEKSTPETQPNNNISVIGDESLQKSIKKELKKVTNLNELIELTKNSKTLNKYSSKQENSEIFLEPEINHDIFILVDLYKSDQEMNILKTILKYSNNKMQLDQKIKIIPFVFWYTSSNSLSDIDALACQPFIEKYIELSQPKQIVVLGSKVANNLLSANHNLRTLSAQPQKLKLNKKEYIMHVVEDIAYLIKMPRAKKIVWQKFINIFSGLK